MAIRTVALALGAALVFIAAPAGAGAPTDFDRRILAELEAKSPEAARAFERANEARERDDMAGARAEYEAVRRLVPDFYHATRRLCGVDIALGDRVLGIGHCRDALAAAETPENLASLAGALLSTPHTPYDVDEAKKLAARAVEIAPEDANARRSTCEVALGDQDIPALRECVSKLRLIAPNESSTDVYAAFLDMFEDHPDAARASLDRARAHGLPPATYESLNALFDSAKPWPLKVWDVAWRIAVGWLSGFAALLLAGWALSRTALRAASLLPASSHGHPQGIEMTLRRVYRAVLWLCCGYYYLSLPLVLLLVVGAGGGIILGFFALGTIPIKLVLIIAVVVASTVGAVLKSLFVKPSRAEPGLRLTLSEHPGLQAALTEVAAKVGTDPVDVVYLTPGTDIAVMERAEMQGLLRGRSKRCLILGAGVLKGMRVIELKSILAHEHGHLQNEDTAGGGFALAVRRSLITTAIALARAGAAAWYNPAWWFLRGFNRVFLIISHGASRLQEVLADRWAVHAYGSEAFASGLRHVIARSARFDAHLNATLSEVLKAGSPLLNLYAHKPAEPRAVDGEIEEAIEAEPSPYDSHPSPKHRIAWALALSTAAPEPQPDDKNFAWTLFSERKKLEEQMTDEVRARILAAHSVAIPKAPPPESAAAAPGE